MDASVELVKRLLASVVHIHAEVPAAHPSARILGDERMGTGIIVDPAGLILTVNYVVMGGETIQVSFGKGRSQRAEIVAVHRVRRRDSGKAEQGGRDIDDGGWLAAHTALCHGAGQSNVCFEPW